MDKERYAEAYKQFDLAAPLMTLHVSRADVLRNKAETLCVEGGDKIGGVQGAERRKSTLDVFSAALSEVETALNHKFEAEVTRAGEKGIKELQAKVYANRAICRDTKSDGAAALDDLNKAFAIAEPGSPLSNFIATEIKSRAAK